jgi:hypothetical protein
MNKEHMETNHSGTFEQKRSRFSPGIPALVYFLLFATGMVLNIAGTSGASFPTPYDPVEKAQQYYTDFADIVRINSFFIFWSALPLGIFTAIITSLLKTLHVSTRGIAIATFGGYAAAVFIGFSGLCTWILSQPGIASDPGITRGIQLLGFASGGTGNVTTSGLLIAGISVTAGFARQVPRWIMWTGLVLAAISVFSMLNMIIPQTSVLLPVGRFLGMIWLVTAGFSLKQR